MNGYTMLAESCRQLLRDGGIDKATAEKEIRVYEFLATCDLDDKCLMVDSTAFNDIIEAYLKQAIKNADIDSKSRQKVLEQLRWMFEGQEAKEVLLNGKEED